LTLAGLRPGQDTTDRAVKLYRKYLQSDLKSATRDARTVWMDVCRKQFLAAEFDTGEKIQVIRATAAPGLMGDCSALPPSPWNTAHGLRVWDSAAKVIQLYGEPDSRSPIRRDGQSLELWHYAFDWAGPEVPQLMEVLCTPEKEGQPGRVVEITLAASSR
jgi:hypothetical protein